MFPVLACAVAFTGFSAGALAQVQSPGPGASTPSDPPAEQPFGTLDSDGDGTLSREEFGGDAALSFDLVDKDGDRRISADEYRDARMKRSPRDAYPER